MANKKILIEALKNINKAKKPVKKKDIIYDNKGQWKFPGQPTRIPSNEITMQGVPYPVLGKGSDDSEQMMYPGAEYTFPGATYVDEYPQMKKGGSKKFSSNLQATNRLFKKNPLFKKKNYKSKTYDPSSMYFKEGGDTKTKLSDKEEKTFQKFYNTLPDNLRSDDDTYDIRGYWDSEGRPEAFNYDQPKQDDGYYHAYSINQNTGEYLKSPAHDTFQHAIDEDRKIGYRPITNVQGRNIATENPSLIEPEAQSFLRNMIGPVAFKQGGQGLVHAQDDGDTDAMTGMMKARLAYANEFGNPAAERMINLPDNPYQFDNGDTGTHYMASMDNYAVPQIQDENGVLQLGDYGPESNEAIRFDSDEDANYFAENYKNVSPGFLNEKQYGGISNNYIEANLNKDEIEEYIRGGYIVEEVNDPSIATLNRLQSGGVSYELGDEVDEDTMKRLKAQGYTFEIIK